MAFSARINALKTQPLSGVLDELGGWPVLVGDSWVEADFFGLIHILNSRNWAMTWRIILCIYVLIVSLRRLIRVSALK